MSTLASFQGTGVAMITPFTRESEVDFDRLIRHADGLIRNGINYLVVLGTTAETPALSGEEKKDIVRAVLEANGGRIPVVVGVGGNDTRAVVENIKSLDPDGIDAILSVVPYYNKPTQEGIYQHYSALAAVAEKPLMLYNVPGRTGANMSADTVVRLATDYPGKIFSVKEASGNFQQMTDILRDKPEEFLLISGDDGITLPMISMGASGVVSVIGNAYPALFSSMVEAALKGDYPKAREVHLQISPMITAIFKEGNPAGVKAAMHIQGWMESVVRLPLVPASASLTEEIRQLDKEIR
jgi:4-hydroxy-tetrahydrodipicolinate synthase